MRLRIRQFIGGLLVLAIPVLLLCLPPMLWEKVTWREVLKVCGTAAGAAVYIVACIWLLRADADRKVDCGPPYVPPKG